MIILGFSVRWVGLTERTRARTAARREVSRADGVLQRLATRLPSREDTAQLAEVLRRQRRGDG